MFNKDNRFKVKKNVKIKKRFKGLFKLNEYMIRRLISSIIDLLLTVLVSGVLISVLGTLAKGLTKGSSVSESILTGLIILFSVISISNIELINGKSSLGKMICGLKVNNGNVFKTLIKNLAKVVLLFVSPTLFILYCVISFFILSSNKKRLIHDLILGLEVTEDSYKPAKEDTNKTYSSKEEVKTSEYKNKVNNKIQSFIDVLRD